MPYEVITTDDKDKRDEMFRRYKTEGNANERQAVKFSGHRALLALTDFGQGAEGEIALDAQGRPMYRSTWSIAYPSSSY